MYEAVPEKVFCGSDYLDLKKLDVQEIVWVDEINGLLNATSCIEACKIIGMDCEWRPNFEKNSKPSKVRNTLVSIGVGFHVCLVFSGITLICVIQVIAKWHWPMGASNPR